MSAFSGGLTTSRNRTQPIELDIKEEKSGVDALSSSSWIHAVTGSLAAVGVVFFVAY